MQFNDAVNGAMELVGAALSWWNVRTLYRDKTVAGVYWPVTGFFAAWGLWNTYYYPSLGQWASFAAGVLLAAANLTWAAMAYHYTRKGV